MRKRWDGLLVCPEDFEPRHPQLSLRVRGDKQSVPMPRPDPEQDTFISVCYVWQSSGYADLASAECARADEDSIAYSVLVDASSTQVG